MSYVKTLYLSTLIVISFFLISPARAANADESAADAYKKDIQSQLQTPQPRINIPGLDFKDIREDPSNVRITQTDEGRIKGIVSVPFIGVYIAAVYRYAVVVASLLAVIMIIFAGVQWTTSGGSSEAISSAKTRITNAVVGLCIALGSYTLLYTINPELVQFRALKLDYVGTADSGDFIDYGPPSETLVSSAQLSQIRERVKQAKKINPNSHCTHGNRCAFEVTMEDIDALAGVARKLTSSGLSIVPDGSDRNTPIPFTSIDKEKCPLLTPSLIKQNEVSNTNISLETLYEKYAPCIPIKKGRNLMKIFAQIESNENPGVHNFAGMAGLAQTNNRYCPSYLTTSEVKKYCTMGINVAVPNSSGYNTSLLYPEVGVMVIASSIQQSLAYIQTQCPNGVNEANFAAFAYISHNIGAGSLRLIMKQLKQANNDNCNAPIACQIIYNALNQPKSIFYEGDDATSPCPYPS